MKTIEIMRAKHILWQAGLYLQKQYNNTDEPQHKLDIYQAALIILSAHRAVTAN